jgi:hypothetical protein
MSLNRRTKLQNRVTKVRKALKKGRIIVLQPSGFQLAGIRLEGGTKIQIRLAGDPSPYEDLRPFEYPWDHLKEERLWRPTPKELEAEELV